MYHGPFIGDSDPHLNDIEINIDDVKITIWNNLYWFFIIVLIIKYTEIEFKTGIFLKIDDILGLGELYKPKTFLTQSEHLYPNLYGTKGTSKFVK